MVYDLRPALRIAEGSKPPSILMVQDRRNSNPRLKRMYERAMLRINVQNSKLHVAVDALGCLSALYVSPIDEQDRAQVAVLALAVQVVREIIKPMFVDRDYVIC